MVVTSQKELLISIGTRPEAIKMAPIILALRKEEWADVRVLATAQHRQLLDDVLRFFQIEVDIDLDIMQPNQSLASLTARLLQKLEGVLRAEKPDAVLVQGDTTTVMATALSCFYEHIPVGHVEAGLRTWSLQNPYPEEFNRTIVGHMAEWHFAPTELSRENLIRHGVSERQITLTGNTVIDALLLASEKNPRLSIETDPKKRMVLVTVHRRESFGAPFARICGALHTLALQNPEVDFVYPVHPNPNIKGPATDILGNSSNFHLCEPLDYASFIAAMKRAYLIISDSGGVQEEAPALGKPVLVLRDVTERPEAVMQGVVKLVGSNRDQIVAEAQRLLDDSLEYKKMARKISPYGDGYAADRIVDVLRRHFVPCG
jgi:UDP-N-acetylglucosamine 2-epimerase (non-hydrolysing)